VLILLCRPKHLRKDVSKNLLNHSYMIHPMY